MSLDDGASAQRGLRGVHELGRRIGGASVLGGALKLGGRLHQPSRPAPVAHPANGPEWVLPIL